MINPVKIGNTVGNAATSAIKGVTTNVQFPKADVQGNVGGLAHVVADAADTAVANYNKGLMAVKNVNIPTSASREEIIEILRKQGASPEELEGAAKGIAECAAARAAMKKELESVDPALAATFDYIPVMITRQNSSNVADDAFKELIAKHPELKDFMPFPGKVEPSGLGDVKEIVLPQGKPSSLTAPEIVPKN